MPLNKLNENFSEIDKENYIGTIRLALSNSDNGWSNYADSPAINPIDGLGGTPGSTLTQNTSSPLSGLVDFRFTKDASNRQGEGFSYGFSISNRHLAKVLQITFDCELISGTYSSGDLRVSIIQNPTGTPVLIEPVNTSIQLGIINQRVKVIASFQSHVSITSYRLCIHVSSTSTSAYTVDFNNFRIWEPPQSIGAVITDWQSYTPTLVSFGTTTNQDFQWRRVGGNMEIQGRWTTGTSTAVEARIPLPFGTIDSTRIPAIRVVGSATFNGSSSTYFGIYVLGEPSVSYLTLGIQTSTASAIAKINGNALGNFSYTVYASIPLSGWGSTVAMSSDTGDGRVVAFQIKKTSSQTGLSVGFTKVTWQNIQIDTHGSWDSTNNEYIIPISGIYNINSTVRYDSIATGDYIEALIYVNGITVSEFHYEYSGSTDGLVEVNRNLNLTAGQRISIVGRNAIRVYTLGQGGANFSIERISTSNQQIGLSESVNVLYTTVSNSHNSSGNLLDLVYGTRVKDSHSSYNTTTGIFTAPMSGCYDIEGQVVFSANATGYRAIVITNTSNTNLARGTELNANAFVGNLGMASVSFKSYPMLAGQQIKLRYIQNSGGTLALSSDSTWNRLSITMVGNF